MKSIRNPLAIGILAFASLTFAAAHAGDTAPAHHDTGENACKADFEKFCKDKVHGPQEVMECMAKHKDEFSPECKAHRHERRAACKGDVEKFCSKEMGDPGKVMHCLMQHQNELSEQCRNSHRTAPADKGAMH